MLQDCDFIRIPPKIPPNLIKLFEDSLYAVEKVEKAIFSLATYGIKAFIGFCYNSGYTGKKIITKFMELRWIDEDQDLLKERLSVLSVTGTFSKWYDYYYTRYIADRKKLINRKYYNDLISSSNS